MTRQATFLATAIICGIASGIFHTRLQFLGIADKAPVVISIFMAALFVRLARGVPTFPFEKILPEKSHIILSALDHLRNMYANAFVAFILALLSSISFSTFDNNLESGLPHAILIGVFVATLLWALFTAYFIFLTDISLFKSQASAMGDVVNKLEFDAAAASAEVVKANLVRRERKKVD